MTQLMIFFLTTLSVEAEYRAFELVVKNEATGAEKIVLSTLDHIQYPVYYPLQSQEQIYYQSSWRCPGFTGGFKPPCKRPEREPAESPNP